MNKAFMIYIEHIIKIDLKLACHEQQDFVPSVVYFQYFMSSQEVGMNICFINVEPTSYSKGFAV